MGNRDQWERRGWEERWGGGLARGGVRSGDPPHHLRTTLTVFSLPLERWWGWGIRRSPADAVSEGALGRNGDRSDRSGEGERDAGRRAKGDKGDGGMGGMLWGIGSLGECRGNQYIY